MAKKKHGNKLPPFVALTWEMLNSKAFLDLHYLPLTLEVNNGKVVFTFPISDDLYKLIANFNSNVTVPVLDFVTVLKKLRGQMLTMRGRR